MRSEIVVKHKEDDDLKRLERKMAKEREKEREKKQARSNNEEVTFKTRLGKSRLEGVVILPL